MCSSATSDRATITTEKSTLAGVDTVEEAFDHLEPPRFAWCGPERQFVTGGAIKTVTAAGPDRFQQLNAAAATLSTEAQSETGRQTVPFVCGGRFAATSATTGSPWAPFPAAMLVVPAAVVEAAGDRVRLVTTSTAVEPAAVTHAQRRRRLENATGGDTRPAATVTAAEQLVSHSDWRHAVGTIVERITDPAAALEKAVLAQSRRLELSESPHVGAALTRLGARYPDCYRFAAQPTADSMTFIGATPERLLTRRGSRLRTVALAGSTRRGETPATDRQLRAQLRSDPKTDREHALVTATVREQLQAHARSINVGDRSVRRLPRVQHVRTPVTADVAADTPFFSLVDALYPTAAISGSPPAVARRLMADLESFDRGWYTGLVGYCDGTGDGTVAVGIRSALVGDHQARLFAGAGIVAESEPTAEWDETQLKYQPMYELFNGRTEP